MHRRTAASVCGVTLTYVIMQEVFLSWKSGLAEKKSALKNVNGGNNKEKKEAAIIT